MDDFKPTDTRRRLLFVYGSLRRGGEAHALLNLATFVCEASTEPDYETIDHAGYPMLLPGEAVVVGEIFLVPHRLWPEIDAWEEAPAVYRCAPVRLAQWRSESPNRDLLSEGATVWAYFGNLSEF